MNIRQIQILRELYPSRSHVFSTQLAENFGVSERTIRNDVRDINCLLVEYGAEIVRNHHHELTLLVSDENRFKQFIEEEILKDNAHPVEKEDRVIYLVRKFLLSQTYHKLEDLADELYVSRSTAQNDLKDVKVVLKKFDIKVVTRPNYGLILQGDEQQIRNAISELLFERFGRNFINMNQHEWLLDGEKMSFIYEALIRSLKEYTINISDIALNNLVIHIAIAYRRIIDQKIIPEGKGQWIDLTEEFEYKIAQEILKEIETKLNVTFPPLEVSYVTMHLLGTKLNHKVHSSDVDPLGQLVHEIIDKADKTLNLRVANDKELYSAILLHLKPAVHRFKYEMNIRNPMLDAIKANYPLAFEASVIASQVIENHLNIKINEDEIGYIALHFGAAIERRKMVVKPPNILVVCASGLGSAQLLLYKMRRKFGHRINLLEAVEYHNLNAEVLEDVDHILSTIPLPDSINTPWTLVSDIFGDKDMDVVEDIVSERSDFVMDQFLDKDLMFTHMDFKTPEAVIGFLSKVVLENNMVDEDIKESVLHRESVASTAFGQLVAMPHPIESMSQTTFLTIATLKNPIDWYGKQVQLVILLNVAKELEYSLEPLYKHLISLIDDHKRVQACLETTSTRTLWGIIRGY